MSKDIAPYTIVGGVPAKLIRERFEADLGGKMNALGWWDWPHEQLHEALSDFRKLTAVGFVSKYQK